MAKTNNNPRLNAARALMATIDEGRHLDTALATFAHGPESALTQELAYGVLRHFETLEFLAARLLSKPIKPKDRIVHFLLLCGLYQLRTMDIKAHAAVNESVQTAELAGKSWARGLLNACLRRYQREHEALEAACLDDIQARYAHPAWLIRRIQDAYPDHYEEILNANNQRPPMHLRVNLSKISCEDYVAALGAAGLDAHVLTSCDAGIALHLPTAIDKLPHFAEGSVSVQDGAAQLAAPLLDLAPGMRVLDACAAPGGKAAHILETMPALDALVMIEQSARRALRIEENFARLGLQATLVIDDAAATDRWWDGAAFDRILLDAPCSATGVIRRHPDIKRHRTPDDIRSISEIQAHLLASLWPLLAEGGKLLYVTCSIMPEENAQLIAQFISQQADARPCPLPLEWALADKAGGYQILPGTTDLDGFYYACLQKV